MEWIDLHPHLGSIGRVSISSMGLRTRFNAAVFFSPFFAAKMDQAVLGCFHSLLILMKALVPKNDAVAVMSGKRMNSGGTPTASAFAMTI